jgi:hypothetical protein
VGQRHTGRLTGFWFLLDRPKGWILMNEWMNKHYLQTNGILIYTPFVSFPWLLKKQKQCRHAVFKLQYSGLWYYVMWDVIIHVLGESAYTAFRIGTKQSTRYFGTANINQPPTMSACMFQPYWVLMRLLLFVLLHKLPIMFYVSVINNDNQSSLKLAWPKPAKDKNTIT